ncbi:hypothetical protein B0O80DRAFT_170607 [Mortierella sp. GBAus27b]|nr:hypothetical protein BGX31_010385 [Mortierella sp. GBA43]KAI8349137.1 hypothetical protein B0O80DRAFT_170607 [Mortierella sp. GBAus27b]
MGVFTRPYVSTKTNSPRIASLWIMTAFILVSTAQVNPFDKPFGVDLRTYTTIPKLTSLTQKDYVPNKVVVSVNLGLNSEGRSFSTAIAPGVAAYDSTGSSVFKWGMDNDPCDNEDDRIKVNKTNLFQERPKSTGGITSIKVSARDGCAPKGEPVCVSSIVILPSNGDNKSDPIYLSGNTLGLQSSWYWSRDSFDAFDDGCNKLRKPGICVWMSKVPQTYLTIKELEILDVPKFLQENQGTFRPSFHSNLRLDVIGPEWKDITAAPFDYVFYNNVNSAAALCASQTSSGPSFLSLHESRFCAMADKVTIPMCNSTITKECVTRDGSFLKFIPGRRYVRLHSIPHPMPLRFLGPPEAVNSTTGNQTNTAPDTVKDLSCQPIKRDKLSVGEKLWAGEHLASAGRNAFLLLKTDGYLVKTFGYNGPALPTNNHITPYSNATYYLELLDDGRICTQLWNTTVQQCMGPGLPKDNYTVELYNNGFLYVKKSSGETVQIDKYSVLTSLKAGEKMTETSCLISSDQSTIVTLVTMDLKSFRLKDYQFEQAASIFPTKLELHRDGKLTVSTGSMSKVLFIGGFEDNEYTLHVTNNGRIRISRSDGLIRWESAVLTGEPQ